MFSVLLIIPESISQIAFISTSLLFKHKFEIHCPLKPVPIMPNLKFEVFWLAPSFRDERKAVEAPTKADFLIKFLRFIFFADKIITST